jgi:hypothetical protein
LQKNNRDECFLPLSLGNTARHPQVLHPKVESTRQNRKIKGVLVNSPTFTWAYTRTFKEREIEEILNSIDTDSFSNQTANGMLFILIKHFDNELQKIFTETITSNLEKLKIRTL